MKDAIIDLIVRSGDEWFAPLFRGLVRWYNTNRTTATLVTILIVAGIAVAIWFIQQAYLLGADEQVRQGRTSDALSGFAESPSSFASTVTESKTTRNATSDGITKNEVVSVRAELRSPLLGSNTAPVVVTSLEAFKGSIVAQSQVVLRMRTELCTLGVIASVSGRIVEVHVRAGDVVRDGDPLFDVMPIR